MSGSGKISEKKRAPGESKTTENNNVSYYPCGHCIILSKSIFIYYSNEQYIVRVYSTFRTRHTYFLKHLTVLFVTWKRYKHPVSQSRRAPEFLNEMTEGEVDIF